MQVADLLPAGLTFISAVPSKGSYVSATGLWTVGAVTTLVNQTLVVKARVDSPGVTTNTATISGADQFDPNPGNNQSSVTLTPLQADLGLVKTVSDASPNVGDVITYTVTLNNAGPDAATNVEVTDLLPGGLFFVGATPSQGSYSGLNGLWNVGTLANQGVATLQIQARVNSPNAQFNTATISASDQFDPNTGNNNAGVLETPQQADLAVGKSVSNPTPNVGDTITYTIRVSNNGPNDATSVAVADTLPAQVSYVSSTPSAGVFDPATRVWTVGTVAVGTTEILTITAKVTSLGLQSNTANVSNVDQFDPNLANNSNTASINPQHADLQLGKTVNDPTPNVGDTITFTITLTDNGPNTATNVQVRDLLPAGLSFVSAIPSQGSYDSITGLWTVGTVTTAAPQTLRIQASVVSPTAQTNTATIRGADQFDPNTGNNTASATETPQQADLAVTKAVSDATPNVGDTITFTVTLADLGPNAASNVTLEDLLPSGLGLLSFTVSQGSYDPAGGVWTVGAVNPGAAQTLTITALVNSATAQTNIAAVSHSDQFDPVTTNNTASVTETPQHADLALTKTVSNATPNVGDVIAYTITLSNTGPDSATGVRVTDLLPAGLTLVSATQSQGSYNSATGLWIVGQVGTTAPATLALQARVSSSAATTNIATITRSDQFDPVTTNNTASAIETPQQADLALSKGVSDATPNVGDTITFTVTLTNTGPDSATNVTVQDLLPPGLTFVSATPSQGAYDSVIGVWTVGTITTATPLTLAIQARVDDPAAQTNTATIGQSDQFDPVTTNNSASATETPQQADLALTKTVSNATPNVGDTITFTITLTDKGPNTATSVTVQDLLPAGVTFVTANPSQGNYNQTTGVWTVGTVTTATPQTLTIQATVAVSSAQTNTATISHSDQFDPTSGNNSASATETPQKADLAVSKTVNNSTPNVGDTIVYTITLNNNGPDAATNVTVQDTLPTGVIFVSANPSQGSYNSGTGVWTVGTINAGAAPSLLITVTVNSANPAANIASISHSDQFDPNPGNNTDSSSTNPQQADLVVSKSVSDDTPNVGDVITFTITLTNTGPNSATNVTLTDLLPAGLAFVSATPSQGTYGSTTGLWTVGAVANAASETLTLSARVDSPAARTNTASITSSDQFDPNSGNNSASASETPQQADLSLSKSVNDTTPNVGDTITFTVTLANRGPDAASNVAVQDLLPAGLTFVSATVSQGSYNSTTGVWTVGTVNSAAPQTLTLQATVVSPLARTNTAVDSHSDQFDPNPGNNSASATETPQRADLAVGKTVSNPKPNVGDVITFTVVVTNNGPDAATGVTVNDLIPTGLSFVGSSTATGSYNSGNGDWTIGTLDSGGGAVLTINARVVSPAAQTNTASVSHSDQFDPVTGNNSGSATETPQTADLALAKTVSNARPNVGAIVTFTVTLTNLGLDTATNVAVTDLLPAGLSFVAATPSQGSYDNTSGSWVVGAVTTAAPQTLQIQARVVSSTAQTNSATIDQADQFDPVLTNNSASATETPQQSDLALAKSVSNATPNVGDTITFTITLSNIGPDAASNVQVTDLLPAGLTFVSATPSQGAYNSATGIWNAGVVTITATPTLLIRATVVSPDPQTNTAGISHSDQFDPNIPNNQASVTETPQQSDLELTKTVSSAAPNVGDTITFTVTLTNLGVNTATNVQVTDLLPVGLTFVSATPSQGTYSAATGLWSAGSITTATPQTLQIQAKVVSPDTRTNTASISHSDQFDPDSSNNTDNASETPQHADLALTKSVSNPTPNVGDTITFTITLSNLGSDAASNVSVKDLLPAGLAFVSSNASQGSYSNATGIWSVGTVTTAAPQNLLIQASVVSASQQTNVASLNHSDQFDPDSSNNSASATETPQKADLALAKTVSDATPNVGDVITFTVTLTDNGPDSATNVTVTDLLPVGLAFVAAMPSQGAYDNVSGLWTVGTVTTTASQTLQIQATVISATTQSNTASISHSDQFDPVTTNNSATAGATAQNADLQLAKSVSNAKPNVGDNITFTITLTDKGPDSATNVQVTDLLPAGLTFVSAAASLGAYNAATGVWTVGIVTTGTPQTLQIQATVTSAAAQTNIATVTASDQFDPVTTNNSAGATETPQQSDLALAKTVSNGTPNVGDTITFTITLSNAGPDSATNAQVTDLLPAGLAFVSATPSKGTYDGVTGIWTVGTVTTSLSQTLQIRARVVSPAAVTNTASITDAAQFDPNTGNNTASITETPQQSDLALNKTVSNATPNVGETITFTITLSNSGPDAASNVSVQDLLPNGLTFVSATPSQGTYVAGTGLWTVGTVTTATPQTLLIQAKVASSAAQTNTASISHSDQFDPASGNNTDSVTETPQHADLALAKSVSNPTPNVADAITFTITLTDIGPDSATNVLVADLLPTGVSFVSANPSQGTYNNTTGVWRVGTVTTATPQTLTILATVVSASAQTNTATISHSDQFDPASGNNTASVTETPQQSDLEITKTVSNPTPNVDDNITYTITVTNNGPNAATNVAVLDTLPGTVTFVSATTSQGTYDSASGLWTVGTVNASSVQTLTITASVTSANPGTNTASISHSDQFDPNSSNNSDASSINPQEADLTLGKTVSNATPNVGDTISFTVTLTNSGPNTATNVRVTDLLPAGLTFVSAIPGQGTYASGTGLWTVGTLANLAQTTLTLQAKVASSQARTNIATISHSDQFDSNTANNSASATETPQSADLALAKTVDVSRPNVGDTITFTVTLSNVGPDSATNVAVNDLLPAGLSLISATPSQGSYSGGVWTVGTVTPSLAQTLTIAAQVVSPNAQTNTASIAHSDQFDPAGSNNTASVTETPQKADLALTKTVSPTAPNVGGTVAYVVTLTNKGPDAATSIRVNDLLPSGLNLISAVPSVGVYVSSSGLWAISGLANGGTATLTLNAEVLSPNPQNNTATISGADQFDPVTTNNSASAVATPQQADLALAKTVSNATPNVGDTIRFTISLGNHGPNTATNVTVNDVLPSGLTLVSATPSQGSYNSATGVWTVGSVATTAAPSLVLQAKVISPQSQTNVAVIDNADQFDPNPANNSASASETPQQADLAVAKTVSDPTPNVGDTITYTITLTNNGPNSATNVQVFDLLPAGLTFVSATPSKGTYSNTTGLWSVGTVTTALPQTLTIRARVTSPLNHTNTATISHSDQFDPNSTNNSASAGETPQQADLAVSKSVNDDTPNVGDTVTFTVSVVNFGLDNATNVTVKDLLPVGLVFVSATPSQGTYAPATGIWTVGTVTLTTPQTLQIQARVASPIALTNTASITHSDQFDPNSGNNSASVTETPQKADLRITKSVSDAKPNVGDTITFTVTLTNIGPDLATNVRVNDLLPAGLTFVAAVPSQGTYNSVAGVWDVGAVTAAVPQTLQIQATVASPAARTNIATIGHSDQFDPVLTNNIASATETPQRANLALTKTVNNAAPNVGDIITFTITLSNTGPDAATNVQVNDLLPSGVIFVSATASQGAYDEASGLWSVGTVAPGAPKTLQIRATVTSPAAQTNTASIGHSDQFDPNTGNNTASVTETPQQSDLALAKTVSNATPNVGDTITFTITLSNSGPNTASNVKVTDLLPAGLTFVSATASQGTYVAGSGLWTVGTVTIATSPTLQIRAKVVSPGPLSNTATISDADQFDPNPGNNSASVTETPQQSDLALAKTVSDATPNVGDTITFTITLSNSGPNTATNVRVSDLLPAGLTFVAATPSQGTYASGTGLWTVGTVTTATPQTLQIQAKVVSTSAQTNTANISHSDQFDPGAANNTARATETPQHADLALTKTVSDATPNVGDNITFTVTLSNTGPDAATNVQVTDLLPAGLTFVTATPSQGSYNNTTGVWTVGTVTTATPQTLLIQATVASSAQQTNSASITHSDQFDPSGGNNTAAVSETPQRSDLQIIKTVDNPTPNVGDTVHYTITFINNGPDAATNVIVLDTLPGTVTFVSATPSQGTYDSSTGLWTVGTVNASSVQTLTITVSVASANPGTNTASISHSDQFDPNSGNNSDASSIDPEEADLILGKTVSDATPNVGDTISFTVTLTNSGPNSATNVRVTDLLPAGLTFVSANPGQGTFTVATGLWTVGTLANLAQTTLTLQAKVVSSLARTNIATISHSDQFDSNTANNSASATETPQRADLALAKTVDDSRPNVGDTITFTVTLSNVGPDSATNVTVNDLLPAGLSLISATPSQGNYSGGVWTVGTVTPSLAQTLTIAAQVVSPNAQTNTASIAHSDQFDPAGSNNTASATETPQKADLALTKTVSPTAPNFGDTVAYVVTLTNKGPDAATGIRVNDLLPAGLTLISAVPSVGVYVSSSGLWSINSLANSGTATLTLNAAVISPNPQNNTATISGADQFDPVTTNNSASAVATPQQSDLVLAKTVSNATPNVGDTIRFTISLSNHGPNTATNVTVNDLLPSGLTLVSATPSQGSYNSTTGVWTVGSVATSAAPSLVLQAKVISPQSQTNVAVIDSADQFDPNTANNSASASETPQQADLAVAKTVSDPTPNVGDTITYTITLTNNGPNSATNVQVFDLLPTGLTFVSATPNQGSYNSLTGVWTVGAVSNTASETLLLVARVVSPQATTNTAAVTRSNQFDPDQSNNQASVEETPQSADLSLAKTVDNAKPVVGDTITYTLTLTNLGPDTADNVVIIDRLPAGLTFVSALPSQGIYNPTSGVWAVGAMPPGTQTLQLRARVNVATPLTNTAGITHSDQFDPDKTNNTDSVTLTPTAPKADLAVTKSASQTLVVQGLNVTYTFVIRNLGPNTATGVTVVDPFPPGLVFVSAATPSQGTYDSVHGIWNVGTLVNGAVATLKVTARVMLTGPLVNTVRSTAVEVDPDLANNISTVTVFGIQISKRLFLASSRTIVTL